MLPSIKAASHKNLFFLTFKKTSNSTDLTGLSSPSTRFELNLRSNWMDAQ